MSCCLLAAVFVVAHCCLLLFALFVAHVRRRRDVKHYPEHIPLADLANIFNFELRMSGTTMAISEQDCVAMWDDLQDDVAAGHNEQQGQLHRYVFIESK